MTPELSESVQMQFLRPGQLEAAARAFPVVYVPFGLIEWHGRQLPLGNDALKAHAFLVKTAEQFGGVVYPPVFFHDEFGQDIMVPVVTKLFEKLKATGFRVIIGVSGHNVQGQIDMINASLVPVTADGTVAGMGMWEITLSECEDSATDHAAKVYADENGATIIYYAKKNVRNVKVTIDLASLGLAKKAGGGQAGKRAKRTFRVNGKENEAGYKVIE